MAHAQSIDTAAERYRLFVESSPLIPWEADAKTWQFTYVGPQAEDVLGYPLEAWYTHGFWTEHIHEDDREQALATCLRLSANGGHYEFEYRMVRADGRSVWMQDVVSVEMQDGVPALLRGYLIDVTTRKEAESKLARSERWMRVMADALPVVISYIGSDLRYRFSNLAHQKLHNLTRDEIIGRLAWQVGGRDTYDAVEHHIKAALGGQEITYEAQVPHQGVLRHVHASYVPHFDGEGNVLGIYLLVQDVSERVQAEEESRRHRAELAHVARVATVGELSASFAHQLNQPLAAIVSNAQAARRYLEREQPDYHELQGALVDIADDGKQTGEIIHRIRSLLKKDDLAHTPLHINGVVQDVLALVCRDLTGLGVAVHTDLAGDLPALLGDRIQLQQVVLNLALNALEAMESQEDALCELTFRTFLFDRDHVCVSVTDSGNGIAPDEQDRIFAGFYTTKADGLGMGLSINRTIVEAHGGRLWCDTNAERGTTFSFTLPVAEPKNVANGGAVS